MKKQAGIVIAIVVTLLTMGSAFAIQHYASADQPLSAQTASSSAHHETTTSEQPSTSSATSSSAKVQEHHSKKKATSSSRRSTSKHAVKSSSKKATSTTQQSRVQQAKKQSKTKVKKAATTKTATKTTKQPTRKSQQTTSAAKTVKLTVTGYKKTFFNGKIKVNANSTAFSVLQASKLKLVYQNGVAVYVSSINGLAENAIKVGSGWKYQVNGKFIDKGANKEHVSAGDTVHWYFTTKGY